MRGGFVRLICVLLCFFGRFLVVWFVFWCFFLERVEEGYADGEYSKYGVQDDITHDLIMPNNLKF